MLETSVNDIECSLPRTQVSSGLYVSGHVSVVGDEPVESLLFHNGTRPGKQQSFWVYLEFRVDHRYRPATALPFNQSGPNPVGVSSWCC